MINVRLTGLWVVQGVLLITLVICPQISRGQVQVSLGQNFTGIRYGTFNTNSQSLPPDCNGDIGPNHYVEFINGMFVVYNKTNGHKVDLRTDVDFWANAGVGVDVGNGATVSDPRVIYDPVSQRWFASQIDVNIQIDPNTLSESFGTNNFLLAVSATSDPTGEWDGISFPSDPTGNYFADFPTLGVDSNGVYLGGDMFDAADDPTTGTDVGCGLVSFPKADVLASPPNFSTRTWHGVLTFSARGQIFQPATCRDGSAVGKVLAVGDIGNNSNPHSNVVTFPVQNVTGPGPATLGASVFTLVPTYVVPQNAAMGIPLFTATQPDGTSMLLANDARFAARAYTVGGVIYGAHNTELNGHIAIRWYRLSASNGSLLEAGTLADPSRDLFFPSIAANPAGTVVIGYNASGLGTYISCYAVAGQTTSGVTTFGSPLLLKSGVRSYHGDDEDPTGLFGNPVSRWGDYSTTSVDPADPNRFWTVQMYPADTNVWATQITELITSSSAAAQLGIVRSGTNVVVSWPSAVAGYHLQASPSLASQVTWTNVTQPVATNGSQASVTLPISAPSMLFRLRNP